MSFACLFTVNSTAFAADISESDMDAVLLQRGYPQIYLDAMSESAKESLYNKPDVVFECATISVYDEETGTLENYNIEANGIMPCGQIDDDELTLTWGMSKYTTSGNVLLTYSYDWLELPPERFQDPIGISWDSTCFEMIDNSFYKVDKYRAYVEGSITQLQTLTHSEAYNYAKGASNGVTWYADLVEHSLLEHVVEIYGHGECLLRPKASSFTTILYGNYVHNKGDVELSLSIPLYGLSFGISGGSSYDEMGNQRTYTYQ